jgi:hypothetical protein
MGVMVAREAIVDAETLEEVGVVAIVEVATVVDEVDIVEVGTTTGAEVGTGTVNAKATVHHRRETRSDPDRTRAGEAVEAMAAEVVTTAVALEQFDS